jgi:hypothetical protein
MGSQKQDGAMEFVVKLKPQRKPQKGDVPGER